MSLRPENPQSMLYHLVRGWISNGTLQGDDQELALAVCDMIRLNAEKIHAQSHLDWLWEQREEQREEQHEPVSRQETVNSPCKFENRRPTLVLTRHSMVVATPDEGVEVFDA